MSAHYTASHIGWMLKQSKPGIAANALMKLCAANEQDDRTIRSEDRKLLYSFAEQIAFRRRMRERGEEWRPDLSAAQEAYLIGLLKDYHGVLAAIATERERQRALRAPLEPRCPRCPEPGDNCTLDCAAQTAASARAPVVIEEPKGARCECCGSWKEASTMRGEFCKDCAGEDYAPEVRPKWDAGPSRVVREGNNLRFQTAKEANVALTGNRFGLVASVKVRPRDEGARRPIKDDPFATIPAAGGTG